MSPRRRVPVSPRPHVAGVAASPRRQRYVPPRFSSAVAALSVRSSPIPRHLKKVGINLLAPGYNWVIIDLAPRVQALMLTIQVAPNVAASGIARNSPSDRQFPNPLQQQVWMILTGLVHDMRQPLSVLEVCADYLNLILPADAPRARQQVEVLRQQVNEANRLLCETLRLLKQSYEHPPEPVAVPVAAPVAASRSLTNVESAPVTY